MKHALLFLTYLAALVASCLVLRFVGFDALEARWLALAGVTLLALILLMHEALKP